MVKRLLLMAPFVLLIFMYGCNQKKETLPGGEEKVSPEIVDNPATASGNNDDKNPPEFLFETTQHHFGDIMQGEKVSYTFKFKNTGGNDLVIAQATGSCGCTVSEFSKEPIPPGGNGEVKVTFDSEGKSGMQSKTVTVLANTIPATKVLTISAEILLPEKK